MGPTGSASATLSNSPFRHQTCGRQFFKAEHRAAFVQSEATLFEGFRSRTFCRQAKRVPICTPSAPNAMAANIASPLPIPPAATTGRPVARRTCGIRVRVVVSSRPLCPPASNPSATMRLLRPPRISVRIYCSTPHGPPSRPPREASG